VNLAGNFLALSCDNLNGTQWLDYKNPQRSMLPQSLAVLFVSRFSFFLAFPTLSSLPTLFSVQQHTMRIFSLIPVWAALATAVAGAALPRAGNCASEVGCNVIQALAKRDFSRQRFSRTVRGLTNAQLLHRGLPLKDPFIRRSRSPSM
jgi:hypothetical protein